MNYMQEWRAKARESKFVRIDNEYWEGIVCLDRTREGYNQFGKECTDFDVVAVRENGDFRRTDKILRVTSKRFLIGLADATKPTWEATHLRVRRVGEGKDIDYRFAFCRLFDMNQQDLEGNLVFDSITEEHPSQ